MRKPAGSVRRASAAAVALATMLGALVLVSLVVEGGVEPAALPASVAAGVGGRRMVLGVHGRLGGRAMEDFKAVDPFRSSKRKVPNGPDPIHNRGTGKSGRSPGRA